MCPTPPRSARGSSAASGDVGAYSAVPMVEVRNRIIMISGSMSPSFGVSSFWCRGFFLLAAFFLKYGVVFILFSTPVYSSTGLVLSGKL